MLLFPRAAHLSSLGGAGVRGRLSERGHHGGGFLERPLKLLVGILLDYLSVLEFLDELHLKLLHLHDFFLLLLSEVVLVVHAFVVGPLHLLKAPLAVLFNLHRRQSFLLIHDLILHAVFLLDLEALELLFLLVLLLDDLGLFGLFAARLENGLLHFAFFVGALFLDREVILGDHALVFVLHLVVVDFLKQVTTKKGKQLVSKAGGEIWSYGACKHAGVRRCVCVRSWRRLTYLLNTVLVALLKREDLIGAFLGIVNFLPRLILFLLKQGDSIC